MTPREAAAAQRQRPQLPPGWPIPPHPANVAPPVPRKRDDAFGRKALGGAIGRVLDALHAIAARREPLPYYAALAERCGLSTDQTRDALNRLVTEGLIRKATGPTQMDAQTEWACEVLLKDGPIMLRSPNGGALQIIDRQCKAPVMTKILEGLTHWPDGRPLPSLTALSKLWGLSYKATHQGLTTLAAQGRLTYNNRSGGKSAARIRIGIGGRVLMSGGWDDV